MSFAETVHQVLVNSKSTDSNIIQETMKMKDQLSKLPGAFSLTLIDFFVNDPTARDIALTLLRRTLQSDGKQITPDEIGLICAQIFHLMPFIQSTQQIVQFIDILFRLREQVPCGWPDFDNILSQQINSPSDLEFKLTFLTKLLEHQGPQMIIDNSQVVLELIQAGLQSDNKDLQQSAMATLSVLAGLVPDGIQPLVEMAIHVAQISLSLDSHFASKIWSMLNEIFSMFPICEYPNMLESLMAAINEALNSQVFSPEDKWFVFQVVEHVIYILPPEMTVQILDSAFAFAMMSCQDSTVLPIDALSLFDSLADNAELYPYFCQKMMEPGTLPCGFVIAASVAEAQKSTVKAEWAFYQQMLQAVTQSPDPLSLQGACYFIGSLGKSFETQVIQDSMYLEILLPLIVHPECHVRQSAYNALEYVFDVVSQKQPGVIERVFAIHEQVPQTDMDQYLNILANAIDNEGVSTENGLQLAQFVSGHIPTSTGALAIAITLLAADEALQPPLFAPTCTAIVDLLTSKAHLREGANFCEAIFRIFGSQAEGLVETFSTAATKNLQSSAPLTQVADCAGRYIRCFGTPAIQEFITLVYHVAVKWMESDNTSVDGAQVIAMIANFLPESAMPQVYELFANKRDPDILEYLTDIAKERPDAYQTVENIALEVFNEGEEVMGMKHSQLQAYVYLFTTAFKEPSPLTQKCLEVAFMFMSTQDDHYIDLALDIMTSSVSVGFVPDPNALAQIAMGLLTPEISPELIQNECALLLELMRAGILAPPDVASRLTVLEGWWAQCMEARSAMGLTLTNIALVMWALTFTYGIIDIGFLTQTFEEFPPTEKDETQVMIALVLTGNQEIIMSVAPVLVQGAVTLFAMPELQLKKRGVQKPSLEALGAMVGHVLAQDEQLRALVEQVIAGSQYNAQRVGRFLK